MPTRLTHSTEYLQRGFSDAEKIQMGQELANCHSLIDQQETKLKNVSAQIKLEIAGIKSKEEQLTLLIQTGYEMANVKCRLEYDKPNVGEVSYVREDTGTVVKTRAMTEAERQLELDLVNEANAEAAKEAEANASAAESAKNVTEFFEEQPTPETGTGENLAKTLDADESEQGEPEEEDDDEDEEDGPAVTEVVGGR